MSHQCPECYSVCYCNGDIDDCLLNLDADIARCRHCEDADWESILDEDYENGDN